MNPKHSPHENESGRSAKLEQEIEELRKLFGKKPSHPASPPASSQESSSTQTKTASAPSSTTTAVKQDQQTPRSVGSMTREEFKKKYSKQAMLGLAAQKGDGKETSFFFRLGQRVKELCTAFSCEQSEMKLELLDSLVHALEWFAAPFRQLEICDTPKVYHTLWFEGEKQWLADLRSGVIEILTHKRLKKSVLHQCLKLSLLGLETFGQPFMVNEGTGDVAKGIHVLMRLAYVELHVAMSEAMRDKSTNDDLATIVVASRILEYSIAFLIDEDENFTALPGTRWCELPADDIGKIFATLTDVYKDLLQYFTSIEARMKSDFDFALFPLLKVLLTEFDESLFKEESHKVRVLLEICGAL